MIKPFYPNTSPVKDICCLSHICWVTAVFLFGEEQNITMVFQSSHLNLVYTNWGFGVRSDIMCDTLGMLHKWATSCGSGVNPGKNSTVSIGQEPDILSQTC